MPTSKNLAIFGLFLLMIVSPWWLNDAYPKLNTLLILGFGLIPPILLIRSLWKKSQNSYGITALCMIVYTVFGIMDIVAINTNKLSSLILCIIAIAVFFLILDVRKRDC